MEVIYSVVDDVRDLARFAAANARDLAKLIAVLAAVYGVIVLMGALHLQGVL